MRTSAHILHTMSLSFETIFQDATVIPSAVCSVIVVQPLITYVRYGVCYQESRTCRVRLQVGARFDIQSNLVAPNASLFMQINLMSRPCLIAPSGSRTLKTRPYCCRVCRVICPRPRLYALYDALGPGHMTFDGSAVGRRTAVTWTGTGNVHDAMPDVRRAFRAARQTSVVKRQSIDFSISLCAEQSKLNGLPQGTQSTRCLRAS